MFNPYLPQFAIVQAAKDLNVETRLLTLTLLQQKGFKFNAGQFVMMGLPGFGEAPFDICSSPLDAGKFFEVSVRAMGDLTNHLRNIKKGATVSVRGPFGNGFPSINDNEDIVLVAGGTGFVTFRSIILEKSKSICHSREGGNPGSTSSQILNNRDLQINKETKPHNEPCVLDMSNIKLFLGARNADVLLFKEEYPEWKDAVEFNLALEDTNCDAKTKQCLVSTKITKGFVTDILAQAVIKSETKFFLCGPPPMYKAVLAKLKEKNVLDKNIWLSLERRMHCGLGVCQHCAIGDKYICKDGPVFQYSELVGHEIF